MLFHLNGSVKMKNALISPNEQIGDGYRIAEVTTTPFEVAEPLFWVDCDDSIVPDTYYYSPIENIIKVAPPTINSTIPIGGAPNVIA